ncbi:hypothetical protein APY03_0240 [Variovorax sp. WDL1]|nr:hypothetical protein APY03_0240 [Variovorax sp. WDL1]
MIAARDRTPNIRTQRTQGAFASSASGTPISTGDRTCDDSPPSPSLAQQPSCCCPRPARPTSPTSPSRWSCPSRPAAPPTRWRERWPPR